MVLAAGLGTRLRPLTNDRPKALVEVNGRTLLEITLSRLREFGVREVIVNVHHFADKMVEYLRQHGNFGMRIEVSREDDLLLDTGGGLKKASWFFLDDPNRLDEPFFLHNVDVISAIDLHRLAEFHRQSHSLATLAVQQRESSRQLLFSDQGELSGRWISGHDPEFVRPDPNLKAFAFTGIHAISPRLLQRITEDEVFSIIDTYLRLAGDCERILGFRCDEAYWRDLGKVEQLRQAENELKGKA